MRAYATTAGEPRSDVTFPYSPALDGLRAVAVVVVIASHTALPVPGGSIGVDVFFVLSGFLITSLLLREHRGSGQIRFIAFLARRALRLYLALVAMAITLTGYALFAPESVRGAATLSGLGPTLFYMGNWVRASEGLGHLGLFEHTWSLGVEEQFYLLWPLMLLAILRITGRVRSVAAVALAGCGTALVVRLTVGAGPGAYERIANGLDTQADRLLLGCALAAVLALVVPGDTRHQQLRTVLRWALWPALVFLAAAALIWPRHGAGPAVAVLMTVTALAAGVVVGHMQVDRTGFVARVLSWRPAVYLGIRSYALYLWHYPVFVVLYGSGIRLGGEATLAVGAVSSLLLAELSYRFIERPFLRLKARFPLVGRPVSEPPTVPIGRLVRLSDRS